MFSREYLVEVVATAFYRAEKQESKLNPAIYTMEGMNSYKVKIFMNTLGEQLTGGSYLEVGSYKGASLISTIYKNHLSFVTAVDNFSEFDGTEEIIQSNLKKFCPERAVNFINQDCFKEGILGERKYDLYFYDGNHSEESHKRSLLAHIKNMSDTFIYVVDDSNWQSVRNGVNQGIKECNLKEWLRLELATSGNGDTDGYWNGLMIFVLSKQ
jgi:hypothetical protein